MFEFLKKYDLEITWFMVGFMIATGLNSLGKHDWGWAIFCFLVAGINIVLQNIKNDTAKF
jgi:uncharacterized membrane protein